MNEAGLSRRDVLAAAAAAPLLTTLACERPQRAPDPAPAHAPVLPKHVVVLLSDDQSRFDLGCYGNRDCHSPNIDKLAAQGLRFQCGYVVVGVCKPSRSAMYTGLYPHKNGATGFKPINADVATWTELLTRATCATGMLGKLNVEPTEKFQFEKWIRPKAAGDSREPEAMAEAFAQLLDAFEGRRMALLVNLKDPHRPFREQEPDPDEPLSPVPHDPRKCSVPPNLYDTPETRAELALYYDAIWRLDRTVGKLLAVLDERGLAADTLLVFASDNGQPFPFAKTTLYEAGINVPFIVRWPGVVAPGGTSDALVSLVDLLPTALEAFGVASPRPLDGRSLLPLLRGETRALRAEFVGEHTEQLVGQPMPARSIRDGRYKYIRNFNPGVEFDNNVIDHSETWSSWVQAMEHDPALRTRMQHLLKRPAEELYDLERDPWELTNLAGDRDSAGVLATLRARLDAWMRDNGDPLYAG